MIIDGHAHACGVYNNLESIINYLDKNNIDKLILSAGEAGSKRDYSYPIMSNIFKSEKLSYTFNKIISVIAKVNKLSKHIDEQNEYVYNIAKNSNGRVINTYWVNPLDEDCIMKLNEKYLLYNFKIIKTHQCWTQFDILDENFINVVKWAKEKNIPVFIHLSSKKQVEKFIDLINKFEEVTFIVAHMIGFNEIAAKSKNKSIYFDLSAPQLYSFGTLDNAVKLLGSKKFIMGSDTPYGKDNIEINIKRLNKLKLNDSEMQDILWRNIFNILNIN